MNGGPKSFPEFKRNSQNSASSLIEMFRSITSTHQSVCFIGFSVTAQAPVSKVDDIDDYASGSLAGQYNGAKTAYAAGRRAASPKMHAVVAQSPFGSRAACSLYAMLDGRFMTGARR